jgi:hypothetical protein
MRALSLNLLALPFYFIPVVNLIVYALVNGRLLVREYFFAITLRHLSLNDANELYIIEKKRLFMAGLLLAGSFCYSGCQYSGPDCCNFPFDSSACQKKRFGSASKACARPCKSATDFKVGARG